MYIVQHLYLLMIRHIEVEPSTTTADQEVASATTMTDAETQPIKEEGKVCKEMTVMMDALLKCFEGSLLLQRKFFMLDLKNVFFMKSTISLSQRF